MTSQLQAFAMLPVAAIMDDNLSHAEFRALAAIAVYRNTRTGWAFPSHTRIAHDLGLKPSPRSDDRVGELLKASVNRGYLERIVGSGHTRSQYRVKYDQRPPTREEMIEEGAIDTGTPDESDRGADPHESGGITPLKSVTLTPMPHGGVLEDRTRQGNQKIEPERKTHVQPAKVAVERVLGDRPTIISLFEEDAVNEHLPEPMERTIERIPEKTKTLAASKAKVGCAPEAASAPIEVIPKKMEFQDFWDAYPRKTGKLDAERKFIIACRRATAEQIMDGVARYQFSDDPKFIPHPATWLHQGRYLDVQVDLSADQYGLTEWHATIISDGKLSAAMYDPDDLRPILIATGWEPSWRGSLDVLSAWMRDGYVPDSVAKAIASAVAEFGARGALAAFDKYVRFRAERISL